MKLLARIGCLIVLMFLVFSVAHAETETVWIERIMGQNDSIALTNKINEQHIKEVDAYILQGSINPIIWYLRGGFGRGRLGFYYRKLKEEGRRYDLSLPEVQTIVKEYQSYYRKALDLDDSSDAPDHLTATMLSTMGDDVLAAPDIKERAYRKAIALAQAGKANVANENYEYTTWQCLLESYSAQKNPDKYLATLNEMIARFGSSEELERYKRHVEEVITERDRMAALADTYAQTTEPYAEVAKTEPVAEPYAAPKAVEEKPKAEAAKSEESKQPESMQEPGVPEKDNSLILFLAGGAVILVGLVGWLATRRKRK